MEIIKWAVGSGRTIKLDRQELGKFAETLKRANRLPPGTTTQFEDSEGQIWDIEVN